MWLCDVLSFFPCSILEVETVSFAFPWPLLMLCGAAVAAASVVQLPFGVARGARFRAAGLVWHIPVFVPLMAICLVYTYPRALAAYPVPGPDCDWLGLLELYGHALRANFAHQDLAHLCANIGGLLLQGTLLEVLQGPTNAAAVFFAGGIAGVLIWHASIDTVSLIRYRGASPAIYALGAAIGAHVLINWRETPLAWVWALGVVANVALDVYVAAYFPTPNIAYMSHLGGALMGLFLGVAVLTNKRVLAWELAIVAAGALGAVTLLVVGTWGSCDGF